jgi:tRNA uridine 5-carbamoylmethylation protein Kti12
MTRNNTPIKKNNLDLVLKEAKNFLNTSSTKKLFRIGTEIFNAMQPLTDNPNVWNASRFVFNVGKILADEAELWSDDFFESDNWTMPYGRDFNTTLMSVLIKFPHESLRTANENTFVRLVNLNGCMVGWTYNTKTNNYDSIYVEIDKIDIAKAEISRLLWEMFKDRPLVMRYNRQANNRLPDDPKIVFEIDDAFHPMPSQKASSYTTYLKRCLDAGITRSVMLYGPPGTGKSTMARTLIDNLNLRSFRIRVEDISGLDSSTLFEALEIFKPDAVILDDFDKASSQASLLETLEFFQRHVKLVIATVNNKDSLDEAILRPGRFDELVLIDKMDENVVKHILGECVDGFDTVKDWPVAFIQEYVKRRRFMDPSEAIASTVELAARVKRLEKYVDVDDIDKMLKTLNENENKEEKSKSVQRKKLSKKNETTFDLDAALLALRRNQKQR